MNAKEKAKELAWKFAYKAEPFHDGDLPGRKGKECALICVDEIIFNTNRIQKECMAGLSYRSNISYWQEVKQEIQNL